MSRHRRALTLVEILIIVLVLGILAAIITPQFSSADEDTRFSTLRANLLDVRAQLRLYHIQHDGQYPSLAAFVEQMTRPTRQDGTPATSAGGSGALGPYLMSIPANPYTGGNRIGDGKPGTSDWFYAETSGTFRANHEAAFTTY